MIITKNLLKQFIDVPNDIYDITNEKIIEIEAFGPVNTSTNLVVGKVLTCEPHPNSDHLNLTTVDLGDRVEHIVCGASNVGKDQFVIVAQVGTVLPGDFKIKKSKIRGEVSNGMICSLEELGFDESVIPDDAKEGIYNFTEKVEVGMPALEALALDGWQMTLGLTPNRGDLLSVFGFALDLGSVTNQKVNRPNYTYPIDKNVKNPFDIKITSNGCGRYNARYIDQINIKESPWWLKSELIARGMRPINNVVDISNYVLLLLGTPLHMFDASKIGSNEIVVRDAKDGEEVITLDGVTRKLVPDDVVISNGQEAIAIAGVMGLENTMVDDKTTKVLLEAAYFEPKRIAKTSKRLNLKSDASLRFERGIDDTRVQLGMDLATKLLVELADARVYDGVAQAHNHEVKLEDIHIEKGYIQKVLGIDIEEKLLLQYFNQYHYEVKITDNTYVVTPPSYRFDIKIKADVAEEIARVHGINRIPMQQEQVLTTGRLSTKQKRLRMLRHHLADLGLNELITYTLKSEVDVQNYRHLGEPISVLMPLSEDKKVLRQSLLNGLFETLKYNRARQHQDMHVFEIGHVFAKDVEKNMLAIAMHGSWHKQTWAKEQIKADFYVLKGLIDETFQRLHLSFDYQATTDKDFLHPFRQADILFKGKIVGFIGQAHPNTLKNYDLSQTIVAEIDLDLLLDETHKLLYVPMSKYPSISRDLSVVVKEDVNVKRMLDLIAQTVRKYLVSLEVFDVYQGKHIEQGMKSVAFNIVFNDVHKTLESEEVDKLMKKVMIRLDRELDAKVRT